MGAAKLQEPLDPGKEPSPALGDLDMFVPLTTLLQFFFYAGWLKVGVAFYSVDRHGYSLLHCNFEQSGAALHRKGTVSPIHR